MKHNWERDENGNINEWAWEAGFHNGVFCVDCGKSVCVCGNRGLPLCPDRPHPRQEGKGQAVGQV